MKDGKPEVVGYRWETKIPDGIGGGFGYSYASHWSTGPADAEKLIRLSDHEAVVAELRSELERTKERESDTDKQLHALRRAIANTPTDTGDEKHQDALGEWEIILERIVERYEFRDSPQS